MKKNLRYMVMTALLAALTAALVRVNIPIGPGGGIHLGDAVVLLAGCLLPTPYAMAAAAIGGGLGDWIAVWPVYIPATIVIKAAVAALFSAKQDKLLNRRNALMVIPYAAVTLAGYAFYDLLIVAPGLMAGGGKAWTAVLAASVARDSVQVVCSAAVFLLLAFAMDRAGLKKKI